ncbi:MAG: TetR/AcrR family transcriptional regulator [Actinobacteria bacterium]|nr:TetR/AcrR family transcriptional regulator [Actinomycetota bacterium]
MNASTPDERPRSSDRIDPRITQTRRVVREAVLDELADAGFGGLTVESVAARAGVGKSTIYRHWRDRLDLVADALEQLNRQPGPQPDGGTARKQIEQLVHHFATAMGDPRLSATVPALIEAAERDASIAEFFHRYNAQRRQTLVDAIAAGIEAGELPGHLDSELTALALIGPILYRRLMTGEPLSTAQVTDLVATAIGPEHRAWA